MQGRDLNPRPPGYHFVPVAVVCRKPSPVRLCSLALWATPLSKTIHRIVFDSLTQRATLIGLITRYIKRRTDMVRHNVGAGEGFEPPTSGLWARRATKLLYPAIFNWCRRPGSNRYGIIVPQDFKSWASASSATPASSRSDSVSAKALLLYHLRIVLSRGFHKLFLKMHWKFARNGLESPPQMYVLFIFKSFKSRANINLNVLQKPKVCAII